MVLQAHTWLGDAKTVTQCQSEDDQEGIEAELKSLDCHLAIGKFLDIINKDAFVLTFQPALTAESRVSSGSFQFIKFVEIAS